MRLTLVRFVITASLLGSSACATEDLDESAAELATGVALHASPDDVPVGEDGTVYVNWRAARDQAPGSLAFCPVDGPLEHCKAIYGVNPAMTPAGTATFALPLVSVLEQRSYEARWYHKPDPAVNRWIVLATSNPVTPFVDHQITVGADNPEQRGREVTVHWTAPLYHSPFDTIRLYKVGAPYHQPIQAFSIGGHQQRRGSVTFTLPRSVDRGPFEFRFFFGNLPFLLDVAGPVVSPE